MYFFNGIYNKGWSNLDLKLAKWQRSFMFSDWSKLATHMCVSIYMPLK